MSSLGDCRTHVVSSLFSLFPTAASCGSPFDAKIVVWEFYFLCVRLCTKGRFLRKTRLTARTLFLKHTARALCPGVDWHIVEKDNRITLRLKEYQSSSCTSAKSKIKYCGVMRSSFDSVRFQPWFILQTLRCGTQRELDHRVHGGKEARLFVSLAESSCNNTSVNNRP